ncbi:alpha/beta hydrolase [Roseovarius albus]|nr:alpha/beta hydrolase [Roseovarius albus]
MSISAPASAQQAEQQRGIPFLTVRNETSANDRDPYFGKERGPLKAGWCDIGERWLGLPETVTEAAPFHIPEEILRVDDVRSGTPDSVMETLQETSPDNAPLLYTHGFYIDFEKGCRRATIMQENAKLQGRFLWFSWPSDGDLLNYTHDESDLYWSVPDLADAIFEMEETFGPQGVNLAGHSLGGRGMALALNEVALRKPDIRLGELVLLAPDMDFEIFARLLPRIRPIVSDITVYVAKADRPLALSATVHGYARLGETGNDVASLEGVEVIDLSELPVRSPTGHLYHVYNQEVGDDLNQLLNEGKRPHERSNMLYVGDNLWSLLPTE